MGWLPECLRGKVPYADAAAVPPWLLVVLGGLWLDGLGETEGGVFAAAGRF